MSSMASQNSLSVLNKHLSISTKIKFGGCLFIPLIEYILDARKTSQISKTNQ
jgi:hypothetical protein